MRKGFTLLELIIVIIVIGILVAMALPQFARVAERGRGARAQAALDMIRKAEGILFALTGAYSAAIATLDDEVPELTSMDANDTDWAYAIVAAVGPPATFTATATRSAGEYNGRFITVNQAGTIAGTHPVITGTW